MADRGMNQVDLAKASGVHQQLISSYLRRSNSAKFPSLKNLLALGQALHCTLEDLTGLEVLHDFEQKAADITPTPKEQEIIDAYNALPDGDPRKTAIDALLLGLKKPETKQQDGE